MNSYIISLKDENDPYSINLQNTIKNLNINPIWFKGFNGKTINMNDYKHHFNKFCFNFLTKSMIGCALSHFYIWKKIVESENNMALVFEEDVIFTNDFLNDWNNIIYELPDNFDILFLGYINNSHPCLFLPTLLFGISKFKQYKLNDFLVKPRYIAQTHAYLISKQGAEKLIKLLDNKIHNHLDFCINSLYLKDKINLYGLSNRIAFQTSFVTNSLNIIYKCPMILYNYTSKIFIDDHLPLSYIMFFSIFSFCYVEINLVIILTFFIGLISLFSDLYFLINFILLSLTCFPDLIFNKSLNNIKNIFVIFSLLTLPKIIQKIIIYA